MDFDGYCLENLRTAFAVSTCCNGRRAGARVPWGGVGAVCGSPAGAGSGGHGGQPELVTMPEGGEGLQAVLLRAAAPTRRRTIAASFGEMPTASVRRLISPIRRSSGLVELILVQWSE